MTAHIEKHHSSHPHKHSATCGHKMVRHDGHVDYLHDGHLHHPDGNEVDEHTVAVNANTPVRCTPEVHCEDHAHGPGCGHEAIPHGDHVDYLVKGHLHHPHGGHCDDHGKIEVLVAKPH